MKNPNAIVNSDFGPIIININDSGIGKTICQTGYWASADIVLIRQLAELKLAQHPSIMFYDVGANIGTHSLAMAKIFSDKITIKAFEAQRQIFNMLCGTVAINGLTNIYCYNLAVSNINDEELIFDSPNYGEPNNFGGLELIRPTRSDNAEMVISAKESVKTITIDTLQDRVDFLKIDIEGMEHLAIEGAKDTISKYRPICFIEILKTDFNSIFNLFKQQNYVGFQSSADLIFIPIEYNVSLNGLTRVL